MRSLITWITTEPTRSPRDQFLNDSLNGVIYASLLLVVLFMNIPQGWV